MRAIRGEQMRKTGKSAVKPYYAIILALPGSSRIGQPGWQWISDVLPSSGNGWVRFTERGSERDIMLVGCPVVIERRP